MLTEVVARNFAGPDVVVEGEDGVRVDEIVSIVFAVR